MAHAAFAASNVALITGAASGIGLAIARLCASHGMKLLLTDINGPLLAEVAGTFTVPVEAVKMDVGDRGAWSLLREKVDTVFGGRMDLLVLNAGIAPTTAWEDVDAFKKLFETNMYGVLNGIAEFLPVLRDRPDPATRAIVIVGSKQGITNPPRNPGYNASKAAIKSLAEHLSFDLRATPVSVHLLVPGWTYTGFMTAAGMTEKPAGAWTGDQVAERLAEGMKKGQFYVVCPDNDVTEETDKKRIAWAAGDLIEGRPALSRWREEWADRHKEFMEK